MSEEVFVKNCSPTLAGLKTGNLFTYKYNSKKELDRHIKNYNLRLSDKGVKVKVLLRKEKSALIYVYRPNLLKRDLKEDKTVSILKDCGYSCCNLNEYLCNLKSRLKESESFPHEIGLFLGYPACDVLGFIKNAYNFKYIGFWKVYENEEATKLLFNKYRKCINVYVDKLNSGRSIEKLTVKMI